EANAACCRGAESGKCIRHIVQAWNLQVHRDGFTGVARGHLERDSSGRWNWSTREQMSLRVTETVSHRLTQPQIGSKRRLLGIVEVEHSGACRGDEATKKASQFVQRFVVQRNIVQDCDTRSKERDRPVALVHLADERLAFADSGAGESRARSD